MAVPFRCARQILRKVSFIPARQRQMVGNLVALLRENPKHKPSLKSPAVRMKIGAPNGEFSTSREHPGKRDEQGYPMIVKLIEGVIPVRDFARLAHQRRGNPWTLPIRNHT